MSTPDPTTEQVPPPETEPAAKPKKKRKPRSKVMTKMLEAQNRERVQVLQEMVKIRGLMPLLMKKRNGQIWSEAERAELVEQMRAVAHISPYLVVVLLPGSFAMLPVLAWWLDRRRQDRFKGEDA
jgi:hypothetical protein